MLVDPVSPANVYALIGASPNLYKSTDRGVTWKLAGAAGGNLIDLAVDPASSSTLYGLAGTLVEKSSDGGVSWQVADAPALSPSGGLSSLALAPTAPTTVYVAIHPTGMVSSADGGVTWGPVPQGNLAGTTTELQVDPQNPRRLIANVIQAGGLLTMTVPGPCTPGAETLCLGTGGRFLVSATWTTAQAEGAGQAAGLTLDTGAFWFFGAANLELLVKVLDGCALNGQHWVFAAGLTNVGVTVTVTDTQTGAAKSYNNPAGVPFPPLQDTSAFGTCP
jgi:hypothetical protein